MPTTHDQNFKNLILDYPRQAIELFAPGEAEGLTTPGGPIWRSSVSITPFVASGRAITSPAKT